MKYIHQFLIIMLISFVGELLSFLPLPIPASVYGLLIMLVGLLFVPSAVGLMNVKEELFENIAVIMIVLVISTVIVMVVTGKVAQYMIERKNINE